MAFRLGAQSRARRAGVHPDLIRVVERAVDFSVLEGVRTPQRQRELYAQGRTKPGPKVTWTVTSNHFVNAKTGYGHAVDLIPFPVGWEGPARFPQFDTSASALSRLATPPFWFQNPPCGHGRARPGPSQSIRHDPQ